jgi:hypothetical protein
MISADRILASCRIGNRPMFVVGTAQSGITVLSQQVRALNLAWAFIEKKMVDCTIIDSEQQPTKKIAVVGGGFAGLTITAGLLEKGVDAHITIFEERDTLLPLQQGSDSRWLHPQIYNWPGYRSEVSVAMLPVMNWTAARASDVAVQILAEWKRIVSRHEKKVSLFCNARHLQIQETPGDLKSLRIEWVGEERDPKDSTMADDAQKKAVGASDKFDLVILAVGFGLERDGALSYWRNETLGQPSLDQPRKTFLVSGQGDGAMIDLLRLRISQYRQDRILDELFSGKPNLLTAIEKLNARFGSNRQRSGLFRAFEAMSKPNNTVGIEFGNACDELRRRLRRDTEVILRIRQPSFAQLFGPRTSFQNRLLVYMLYKCGGFIPTYVAERLIISQYSIAENCVVRRHGTLRRKQFRRLLSTTLYDAFKRRTQREAPLSLTDVINWRGGYFGFVGPSRKTAKLSGQNRKEWRKEYLPAPTALLASALCSSVVGVLSRTHPRDQRLRVTLHRAISFGSEEVLQQTCDYQGLCLEPELTGGRTFPAGNATIGLAYRCRKVVRSKRRVDRSKLKHVMTTLRLNDASSAMSDKVGFVLAIPLLEPERSFTSPKPVIGVLYVDSMAKGFFIEDDDIRTLVSMAQKFLDGLVASPLEAFGRVHNFRLSEIRKKASPAIDLPRNIGNTLELVHAVPPPRSSGPFQLNYDYSDFVPTQIRDMVSAK